MMIQSVHMPLPQDAVHLWEMLRPKKLAQEDRKDLVNKIMEKVVVGDVSRDPFRSLKASALRCMARSWSWLNITQPAALSSSVLSTVLMSSELRLWLRFGHPW
jgi:hypothetical protein